MADLMAKQLKEIVSQVKNDVTPEVLIKLAGAVESLLAENNAKMWHIHIAAFRTMQDSIKAHTLPHPHNVDWFCSAVSTVQRVHALNVIKLAS